MDAFHTFKQKSLDREREKQKKSDRLKEFWKEDVFVTLSSRSKGMNRGRILYTYSANNYFYNALQGLRHTAIPSWYTCTDGHEST